MSNRTAAALVVLLLTPGLSGCDGTRTVPTGPTPSPPVVPPSPPTPLDTVRGTVYDTAFRRLAGATVEVLDGPHAGTIATTSPRGEFALSGAFDQATRFRAASSGYVPATMLHPHGYIDYYLVSNTPPIPIAGEYELTFVVDPSCTGIPDSLRTRTYSASITPGSFDRIPAGMVFDLMLEGVGALDNPAIGVAGSAVGFRLFNDGYPFIVERVAPDLYLAITGWAEVSAWSAEPPDIAVPFDGWIAVLEGPPMTGARERANCKSHGHQLVIGRR